MKKLLQQLFVLSALLLFAVPGFSTAVLDFGTGTAGSGGTIQLLGSGTVLDPFYIVGSGIPVGQMTVVGLGAFDGSYNTQGTAHGSACVSPCSAAALSFNSKLGTIDILGGVSGLGVATGTNLLTGVGDLITWAVVGCGTNCSIMNVSASGPDSKSPLLLAALGLPSNTTWNVPFAFSIASRFSATGAYVPFSTDISNVSPVPEPATLTLIGTGLLGLVGLVRKKQRA